MTSPGPTAPRAESVEAASRRHVNKSPWNLLLILPFLATLFPWLYNTEEPTLGGIPFFYWFQVMAIGIGVTSTLIVYLATRGER